MRIFSTITEVIETTNPKLVLVMWQSNDKQHQSGGFVMPKDERIYKGKHFKGSDVYSQVRDIIGKDPTSEVLRIEQADRAAA